MAKGDFCKILIRDDFKNVLVVQKKGKKNEIIDTWTIVSKTLKARESEEKAVHRIIKEELKTIVFDLEKIKEEEKEENMMIVFLGTIKERISSNDSVANLKWINKNELETIKIDSKDLEILKEYFDEK